ncbi:MAG: hypothetical protein LBH81_03510 [Rickettsiales bacterium]|jgi:hypothetical protein|nr:hypothetical protein [Rickettsiales bacterium]
MKKLISVFALLAVVGMPSAYALETDDAETKETAVPKRESKKKAETEFSWRPFAFVGTEGGVGMTFGSIDKETRKNTKKWYLSINREITEPGSTNADLAYCSAGSNTCALMYKEGDLSFTRYTGLGGGFIIAGQHGIGAAISWSDAKLAKEGYYDLTGGALRFSGEYTWFTKWGPLVRVGLGIRSYENMTTSVNSYTYTAGEAQSGDTKFKKGGSSVDVQASVGWAF